MEEAVEVKKFINDFPFPSYQEIVKLMEDTQHPELKWYAFQWGAEYGEFQHECMKNMYENILDKEICHKLGEKIYNRGGFVALQACYYIMFYFCPCRKHNSVMKDIFPKLLEHYWNGIGDWQA
jgi:hypothetical protein